MICGITFAISKAAAPPTINGFCSEIRTIRLGAFVNFMEAPAALVAQNFPIVTPPCCRVPHIIINSVFALDDK
jgi:hypothetical protein